VGASKAAGAGLGLGALPSEAELSGAGGELGDELEVEAGAGPALVLLDGESLGTEGGTGAEL